MTDRINQKTRTERGYFHEDKQTDRSYVTDPGLRKQDMAKVMQGNIDSARKELQKPNLSPEMRKMYEEQVSNSEKSLADMQKPDKSALNNEDLAR